MSAEDPTTISSYTETEFPEGPSAMFTSTEIVALPEIFEWIQILFWVLAASFALATFRRERSWPAALMGLGCCCLALPGVLMSFSLFFPNSETAMRMGKALSLPFLYAQVLGVGLLAASAFLRWRRPQ
jgi:hypothetical protein